MPRLRAARRAARIAYLAASPALLCGATSCQAVFGLDDYSEIAPGSVCAMIERETALGAGDTGLCGVRKLGALNNGSELSPGAYCKEGVCYVFFQRKGQDQLLCAACADLEALDCGLPKELDAGILNPYLRASDPPEIWASRGNDIQFATVIDGCTIGPFQTPPATDAVLNTGTEVYPAISPGGTVLLFVREVNGRSRIQMATRSSPGGVFDDDFRVRGLYPEDDLADFDDLRPHPIWNGERLDALLFASTRDGDIIKDIPDLDVYIARQQEGATAADAFTSVERVAQLSGPIADFPPWPLSPSLWLWSHSEEVNAGDPSFDLYVVDVGCGSRFTPWSRARFANVNEPGQDETSPAIAVDGVLAYSGEASGQPTLFEAPAGPDGVFGTPQAVSPVLLGHNLVTTAETDPFRLPDGRLLFVSDREPPSRIWIAGDPPTRAITGASGAIERSPFVDTAGDLWLSYGGRIARARPEGDAWGLPEVVPLNTAGSGLDLFPRLTADRRTLLFSSTRDGGFVAFATGDPPPPPSIWAATRPDAGADAWEIFPVPELSSINGAEGAWLSPGGCEVAFAGKTQAPAFSWDLYAASRVSP